MVSSMGIPALSSEWTNWHLSFARQPEPDLEFSDEDLDEAVPPPAPPMNTPKRSGKGECRIGEQARLYPHDNARRQLQMTMEEIRGRHRIDLQPKRLSQIGLKRQLQGRHQGIGVLFLVRPIHDDGTGGFRDQIEHPFRHFLVERGEDRQQVLLPSLLNEGLQRIDRRIRVTVVMASRIDQMNQIPRERIRS